MNDSGKHAMILQIVRELKIHAPFTVFGAITGIIIILFFRNMSSELSYNIFYVLHPAHVVLSALVTSSVYKLHSCKKLNGKCLRGKCNFGVLIFIGIAGSIGIATLSDSIIPYLGEALLDMPNRGLHIGFIEKWWLVNPLAVMGVAIAYFKPSTKFPHAGHVMLSTWASLFHIILAAGLEMGWLSYITIFVFLFIATWLPCCVSDIVFPMLFVTEKN
jgi:hypothetical protein